jgi:alpha-amylase
MPSICFYFQVHQPFRMRPYGLFEVGTHQDYFDDAQNRKICKKVAQKCYLPANKLMLELLKKHPEFKISYSISGVALEQFERYTPEVLQSFKDLVATGQVEILGETYYHSLAALFDGNEFRAQVKKHADTVKHHFGITPTAFRNTELIYSDGIADMVSQMGYKVMLTEGVDRILEWRSPNFLYEVANDSQMKLLLKNYKLSDDIAFRFSARGWAEWPLTTEKFASWLHSIDGSGDVINLFMDYETIGEHQWEDTGIFEFFKGLPEAVYTHPAFNFITPTEAAERYFPLSKISVPNAISWADTERDLSAWLGNPMQDTSVEAIYAFTKAVLNSGDENLIHTWRKLQTSDHFYYMCTKFWSDNDVHKYFSAYEAPHDAYAIMNNIICDLEIRLKRVEGATLPTMTDISSPTLLEKPITKKATKASKTKSLSKK